LNEAFVEQQQAKLRAETVDQFLQKFDLDPQHAAILDTFDLSDIQQDGFVFLEALDRVYKIKRELSTQNVFSDQAQHGLGASSAIPKRRRSSSDSTNFQSITVQSENRNDALLQQHKQLSSCMCRRH
jgi:hypothetical protein